MVPRGLKIAVRGTEIDILSQFQEEKIRMVWLQKLKREEPETHPLGFSSDQNIVAMITRWPYQPLKPWRKTVLF